MKLKKLTVCVDMYGCPNRCKHCWIGHAPNANLTMNDLIYIAEEFNGYAKEFEIFDWYREPDYADNYKELWNLTNSLSTH